jgi:dimethylamine monooxygenase subunit A
MRAGSFDPMTSLAELFPEGDYRFHLSLRRDQPATFFQAQDATGAILKERAHWLAVDPPRYAALLPEGFPLVEEFVGLAAEWSGTGQSSERSGIHELGARFEPDLLFLSADEKGEFRLRGGALCFPTGWALEEKLGHPMEFIHAVVPGLNSTLGNPIQQFLSRLKPGQAYLRDNWGLAASDELNLHPARQLPAPSPPVDLQQLWLRVEHQALLALPRTGGVVFGIRISLHRLDRVAQDPAADRLRKALVTMPREIAAYKRLDTIREDVIRLL